MVWFLAAAIAKNHNTLQQVDTGKIYWKPCSHLMVWFSAAAASKSPSCRILALQSSVCSTLEMLQSSHCASNTLMQSLHWTFSTLLQSSHCPSGTLLQSSHFAFNTLQQSSHRTFSALMQWLLYYFWHITANITLSHSFLWSGLYLQYIMLHFFNHYTVPLVHCCNHCIVPNALWPFLQSSHWTLTHRNHNITFISAHNHTVI